MDIYILINIIVSGLTGGWREARASESITAIVLSHQLVTGGVSLTRHSWVQYGL